MEAKHSPGIWKAVKNEHAEVLEFRNMEAPSLKAAIFDMDMIAAESRTKNHAYHVQMRAAPASLISRHLVAESIIRCLALTCVMSKHYA